MNPDYFHFPRELSGPNPIEEAVAKLRQEYGKVLNDWLERCVEQWCPEALHFFRVGNVQGAIEALNSRDFYYVCLPDDRYEFKQGDSVLARCIVECNFTTPSVRDPTPFPKSALGIPA